MKGKIISALFASLNWWAFVVVVIVIVCLLVCLSVCVCARVPSTLCSLMHISNIQYTSVQVHICTQFPTTTTKIRSTVWKHTNTRHLQKSRNDTDGLICCPKHRMLYCYHKVICSPKQAAQHWPQVPNRSKHKGSSLSLLPSADLAIAPRPTPWARWRVWREGNCLHSRTGTGRPWHSEESPSGHRTGTNCDLGTVPAPTHTHMHTHTNTHKCTHACTHTHKHMHAHTHTNTHSQAHAHTHTHAYTHTNTHTHIHTQTQMFVYFKKKNTHLSLLLFLNSKLKCPIQYIHICFFKAQLCLPEPDSTLITFDWGSKKTVSHYMLPLSGGIRQSLTLYSVFDWRNKTISHTITPFDWGNKTISHTLHSHYIVPLTGEIRLSPMTGEIRLSPTLYSPFDWGNKTISHTIHSHWAL